jgi:hypothetical protein
MDSSLLLNVQHFQMTAVKALDKCALSVRDRIGLVSGYGDVTPLIVQATP